MVGARIKEPEAAKGGVADASIFGIPLNEGNLFKSFIEMPL